MTEFRKRHKDGQVFPVDEGRKYSKSYDDDESSNTLTSKQEGNVRGWTEFNHIHSYKIVKLDYKTRDSDIVSPKVAVGVDGHGKVYAFDVNSREYSGEEKELAYGIYEGDTVRATLPRGDIVNGRAIGYEDDHFRIIDKSNRQYTVYKTKVKLDL